MKTVKQMHKKWINDPAYQAAYSELEGEFEIAKALIAARTQAHLTQKDLAKRMKTSQSAIARLESGEANPSVSMLKRYAAATGTRLIIDLSSAV